MGQLHSKWPLQDSVLDQLLIDTTFQPTQIRDLHRRFLELNRAQRVEKGQPYLRWSDLQQEPHLSTNPLSQRIIETFFDEAIGHQTDKESKLFFSEFCKMLSM